MPRSALIVAPLLAWIGATALAEPAPWPQWRGPTRDGVVAGPAWPDSIAEDRLKLLWRVDLGESYASPIVSSDAVFTVETSGKEQEIVRALDRKTGKQLWERGWTGSITVPFFAAANGSWVRATPAFDGQRLYVGGMRDVLVCLDAKSGEEVWRVDFVKRFEAPLPAFGFVSSPLIDGNAVYVQAGASTVKLNKATGETIWRTLTDTGGMWGSAFASPFLATIHGKPQLLVQTRTHLAGVSPDNGSVLWQHKTDAFRGMNILTPVTYDNTVFTSAYGGKTIQLKIDRTGDAYSATQSWSNRLQGYMCSPVIINEHAYFLARNKRFNCVALADGEIKWSGDQVSSEYWSLVAQGDRILALEHRGTLRLIKANPQKYEVLAERKLVDAETWAHLAVAGDELFVRELKGMSVYRWK